MDIELGPLIDWMELNKIVGLGLLWSTSGHNTTSSGKPIDVTRNKILWILLLFWVVVNGHCGKGHHSFLTAPPLNKRM